MRNLSKKAFTLVELLIVIGIIGLLAVTVLVTLNPAEAQKKTRDTKRLKDAQVLQTIVEQFLSDGNNPVAAWAAPGVRSNMTATGAVNNTTNDMGCAAANNWLRINACPYVRLVPVDPMNNRDTTCATSAAAGTVACADVSYEFAIPAAGSSNYEIRVRLESAGNAAKLNEGGDDVDYYEIWNNVNSVL
jgi:prepilin-type N-terminal cleavage/methylation domain-containing protein